MAPGLWEVKQLCAAWQGVGGGVRMRSGDVQPKEAHVLKEMEVTAVCILS